jgi:hypothetical protein
MEAANEVFAVVKQMYNEIETGGREGARRALDEKAAEKIEAASEEPTADAAPAEAPPV